MEYRVKITAESGNVIALGYEEDGKTNFEEVNIMFDTTEDEVLSRSDGILAKIELTGSITEVSGSTQKNNTQQLIELFKWAKSNESDEIYRKVEIEAWTQTTRIRCYVFENMFVVDYKEQYGPQKNSKFFLKMNQLEDNFDKINTFE